MSERVCGCGDVMFLPWEKDKCERCMPLESLPTSNEAYRMMRDELMALSPLIAAVEHYIFFGSGQQQGTRIRQEDNQPSIESERGKVMQMLYDWRSKHGR